MSPQPIMCAPAFATSSARAVQPSGHRSVRVSLSAAALTNARTVGPAPEMTAGTSVWRSSDMNSNDSGMTGDRYAWWSSSCVAASSSSGWPVSAATNSAARPALRAASPCGTSAGSSCRAWAVDTSYGGTKTTIDATTGRCQATTSSRSFQAMVSPPYSAAATLSGCPSILDARVSASASGSSCSPPSTSARAATIAPTIADEEDPNPRACGMRFTHRTRRPSGRQPIASKAVSMVEATRCDSSPGSTPAPMPSISTTTPSPATSAVISSPNPSASPMASYPGPMFALVAGEAIVTGRVARRGLTIDPSRSCQTRDPSGRVDVGVDPLVDDGAATRQCRVDVFESVPGDRHDHHLPRGDLAALGRGEEACDSRCRCRLDEDTVVGGEVTLCLQDLVVRHRVDRALRLVPRTY